MKKIICLLSMVMTVSCILTGCTGETAVVLAENGDSPAGIGFQAEGESKATGVLAEKSASGIVEAVDSYTIAAPFGGLLEHFDIRRGDAISKGDVLFGLETVKVYSPRDGMVTAIRAVSGDYAQTVQARYGALCYIEPEPGLVINAAVSGAYEKTGNKTVHVGELLYVKNNSNARFKGEGEVVGVNQDKYRVELEKGSLENGDTVNLYRDNAYSDASKVGTGKVSRIDPVPVTAQGSVLKVHVSEGQKIKRGELMFEMVGGDLTGRNNSDAGKNDGNKDASAANKENTIKADSAGVLGEIFVTAGQPVQKDQPLATLYSTSDMVVIAEVDEIDVGSLEEGDDVTIVFDGIPDKIFEGNIEKISGLGIKKQNASYFDVKVSFKPDPKVRLGMGANVYFEE